MDVFNVEGIEPYVTYPRSYKKFQHFLDFETIFTDIQKFQIDDLKNLIIEAFKYIDRTDMMLSINPDLLQNLQEDQNITNLDELNFASLDKDLDFLDYKVVKNDLNLCVWLNKNALQDISFINFLTDMKYMTSNVSLNLLNLDLFESEPLSDSDMLNLFLEKNFFNLDYFTIAINSKKYSLCYLLFIFKIKKNIINYELYYNKYCKKTRKKYEKIIYDYH